eukprot:442972_1
MATNDISTAPSLATSSNNLFDYSRISSLSTQEQKLWSARQDVSTLNQLRSGARFLDLRIEASGSGTYNAYNGLLGADVSSIIDDIDSFIQDASDEIIILYLSAFHGSNAELQGLYDLFSNSNLDSVMVPNSVDLTTKTLQSMLDDGTNVIAFSDDLSTATPPNTFFDSTTFLHIPTTSDANFTLGRLEEVHQVRSFVTSNIRHGWPSNTLNLIYWTRDIDPFGPFTQPTKYNSFREYNVPIAFELKHLIASYRKLRFGNVLLVDFIASSDVVEQVILLNYEYSQCADDIATCPSQTSLSTYFKYDDPSPPCTAPHSNLGTDCKRSCGLCPVPIDTPSSSCNTSSDCSSPLYALYGSSTTGECFIRKHSESRFIAKASFCLGLSPYEACGNYEGSAMCGNTADLMVDLVSQCATFCSADYECADGYCNSEWSICLTLNEATTTTTTTLDPNNIQKYDKITSDLPAQYRLDIAIFRAGDAEADYPEDGSIQCTQYTTDCFMENVDANPYVTSILGLILLIIILSILLCVCFSICCPFWCFCDRCCKKCCCRPCYGKSDRKEWSIMKRWGSCVCLGIAMVIVCVLAVDGIIANSELHAHIFDASDYDSFVSASNRLFDDVDDKFGSASNVTDFITDNIENILNTVDGIIGVNATADVNDGIDQMHRILNAMASNYSNGVSLGGIVTNPFDQTARNFTLHCGYCDTIYDTIISANDTLKSEASGALDRVVSTLDSSTELVDATASINSITSQFQGSIDKILNTSRNTQQQYSDYMSTVKTYDTERETYVPVLFALTILFAVFPIFGMALDSKWCFKVNWCLAMCCSVLLLLLAIPFVFMLTLSADFCVRLDEFEDVLPTMNSRLGQDIFNNSALESMNARDTLNLIDTCFDGGSILDVFNLSDMLDWSSYRQQMDDALHIDIAQFFTISELESLQTDVDTLSTNEYSVEVDAFIFTANSIPGCYCVDAAFNRNNLNPGTQCTQIGYSPNTTALHYWNNASWPHQSRCFGAFQNASFAVQIENQTLGEAQQKITTLQEDVQKVFDAYDSVYDAANKLVSSVHDIGCLVDPLFVEFDEVLNDFTNCGFMGVVYHDFKKVGCVTIFDDVYVIGRAIIVIAFLCLLIALWSLCLDYVYGPIETDGRSGKQKHDDDIEMQPGQVGSVSPRSPGADEYVEGVNEIPAGPMRVTSNSPGPMTNGLPGYEQDLDLPMTDDDTGTDGDDDDDVLEAGDDVTVPMRMKSNSADVNYNAMNLGENEEDYPVALTDNDMVDDDMAHVDQSDFED